MFAFGPDQILHPRGLTSWFMTDMLLERPPVVVSQSSPT
jgi:hypothetical protein